MALRYGVESAVVPGGGEWISLPFIKDGVEVNHKYRRIDAKDFRQDKGARQCWWNYAAITDQTLAGHKLIVTEGELDALAAIQSGYVRTISVPGGAPDRPVFGDDPAKYSFVADSLSDLADCREIVLALDGDGPGLALLNDLSIRLGKGRCRYVTYPDGCKDLNDVLLGYGPAGVTKVINGAKWCKVTGLFRMSELPPVPDAVAHDTGIDGLMPHYRLRRGDFCVMTGIPGHGKSTFVNDLACRMADRHGWSTVFASFEQNPQIDHRRALRTWRVGRPVSEQTAEQTVRADMWIDRHFSFVVPDDEEDATLEWLLDKLGAAVVRYGVEMAVIDPWNELDHARSKELSLTEYVGQSIRELKRFAKRFNIHLIVVAHPTKMLKDKEGKIPMPTLYDISDSAHWFNKPDVGIIVHRDEEGSKVRVAKSRYHEAIGEPGTITLMFDKRTARFDGRA